MKMNESSSIKKLVLRKHIEKRHAYDILVRLKCLDSDFAPSKLY